jgi:hypothetical protein
MAVVIPLLTATRPAPQCGREDLAEHLELGLDV